MAFGAAQFHHFPLQQKAASPAPVSSHTGKAPAVLDITDSGVGSQPSHLTHPQHATFAVTGSYSTSIQKGGTVSRQSLTEERG